MTYRSKSAERLLAEVEELSRRHNRKAFWACDNALDIKHIGGVFGRLATCREGYEFFFGIKANLSREQVRVLAKGGMKVMQPGIESLNTHILRLMRKGVTRLQNVNLLKWCTYYKIMPAWNLLHGFPGERIEDYVEEMTTIRLITHLEPPMECLRVRLDRFSPNFCDQTLFPTKWRRPDAAYSYIYPSYVNLEEAAYYYEYEPAADAVAEETHQERRKLVNDWKYEFSYGRRPVLNYRRAESEVVLYDTRSGPDRARSYTLQGLDAAVFEALSSAPRTPGQACSAIMAEWPGLDADEASVTDICEDFCDAGLMIGEGGKYLSLALPEEPEP